MEVTLECSVSPGTLEARFETNTSVHWRAPQVLEGGFGEMEMDICRTGCQSAHVCGGARPVVQSGEMAW